VGASQPRITTAKLGAIRLPTAINALDTGTQFVLAYARATVVSQFVIIGFHFNNLNVPAGYWFFLF